METKPLQIDVESVIRQRLPRHYKYIPKWLIRRVERIIRQDGLNKILNDIGNKKGVEAADIALDDLNIKLKAKGEENIPGEGRFIFASNHPLGGLDGMALISLIGHRYDGDIKFIVNDLLMAVKPFDNIFMPVNKHGRQSRTYAQDIEEQYQSDRQMITFPAGLCSRRLKRGVIGDLEWKKFVVTHAVSSKRDIIPVYFEGQNSKFFYRMARWREKLGIKFNYEMILLPSEMFKSSGSTFNVHFGKPIPWQSLDNHNAREEATRLREKVYEMQNS
ncbi:MAG: 1-acyl-sn-glycerol-3-phosphate acyltransferase [Muribaculaceae bacterium]|nr:1-acyl-sn-glycerol-3-phosphate acyltransferase [Muribaculaceae bacterium]MBR6432212.1 1-acyl-sn-glycerol-3-phosphate acyltransferase [Muribaculaceae bacterium]